MRKYKIQFNNQTHIVFAVSSLAACLKAKRMAGEYKYLVVAI